VGRERGDVVERSGVGKGRAVILRDADFSDVSLFYAGFTWRGWVAYA
jgi:hypothetical protein